MSKSKKSKEITQEEFDQALAIILGDMSASEILRIPGVYEAVSEHLNNEAIDLARELRDEE